MILEPRERISPLAGVVDHYPALLVFMFFFQFWIEAGRPQGYLERSRLAGPVGKQKLDEISRIGDEPR